MKELKRRLAVLLIAVMMAGSLNITGWAETAKERWVLNDEGEWNYWKNGEILKNKMITITNGSGERKTYFLKEDGAMASDEMFQIYDIVDGQDRLFTAYAFPEGRLAKDRWVYLNADGQLGSFAIQDGNWYYFDRNGYRAEDSRWTIDKNEYAFDEEGRMLSETFLEDGEKFYFQHHGKMAKDKWLNIDGDWYSFQKNGICRTGIASDSNAEFDEDGILISGMAPCPTIDSINLQGSTDREAVIGGEPQTITFDAVLASDSNARVQKLTKNHDIWLETFVESETSGTYKITTDIDYDKGTYTIVHTPITPDTVRYRLVIDGVKSDVVAVTSDWGQDSDVEKAKAIESILSMETDDVAAAVDSIKTLFGELGDNSRIKKKWLSEADTLRSLDDTFAAINRNVIVTDLTDAEALLKSGALNLIGGSLNAGRGDMVKLLAAKGDAVTLPETFEKQVSVELNLYMNGLESSELEIPVVVSMPIPNGMKAEGLKVFHIGAEGVPELLDAKAEGSRVSLVTASFSNFVFAGNKESSNSGGGSGGSSGRISIAKAAIPPTPGQWKQLEGGKWQFLKADGTAYANTWIYVKERWYWLDATGMMAEGWQEINGIRYYLTPVDGAMVTGWLFYNSHWYYLDETGAMKTGWVMVDKKQYYLGADGVMLADSVTPDGFTVDASGAKVG